LHLHFELFANLFIFGSPKHCLQDDDPVIDSTTTFFVPLLSNHPNLNDTCSSSPFIACIPNPSEPLPSHLDAE